MSYNTGFLANQVEKSDVSAWVGNSNIIHLISPKAHFLLLNIACNFIFKRRHNNVKMMSVSFKMGEYFKVRLNLFKRWHPKVCKKKTPT